MVKSCQGRSQAPYSPIKKAVMPIFCRIFMNKIVILHLTFDGDKTYIKVVELDKIL